MANWFWDAYTDWAFYNAENKEQLYSPVFIKLKELPESLAGHNLANALEELFPKIEPHELELVKISMDTKFSDIATPADVEFYIYVKTSALMVDEKRARFETFFDILDVGAPVLLAEETPNRVGKDETNVAGPLVAVIDDGIGFLNTAFRNGKDTRFLGCWIQAKEKKAQYSNTVYLGRVLEAGEIQGILDRDGFDEASAYAKLNDELVDKGSHRSTDYAFSHGTHVLDLAAGAEPNDGDYDKVSEWPLLGVQLPPDSVEDSSGMRLETHIVMGVRWVLAQAQAYNYYGPIIINISFGLMAGPKNGTRFSEYQIAKELEKHPLAHVVYAYGNGYRNRMVAQTVSLDKTGVGWIIPPDNYSSSFVEIMALDAKDISESIKYELEYPDGSVLTGLVPAANSYQDLPVEGPVRLYHVGRRLVDPVNNVYRPAHLAIVVAPTATRKPEGLRAPAGQWRIAIKDSDNPAQTYILQIQRGDTIAGYGSNFRQSHFAGKTVWDNEMLDYSAPDPDGNVTRAGTNSAMATVHTRFKAEVSTRIHKVSGAMQVGAEMRPAPYSAMGAQWSGGGPTDSAVSEEGTAQRGVLASGTLSGTVRALSGTSAAAPQITRNLALNGKVLSTITRPATENQFRMAANIDNSIGRSRRRAK